MPPKRRKGKKKAGESKEEIQEHPKPITITKQHVSPTEYAQASSSRTTEYGQTSPSRPTEYEEASSSMASVSSAHTECVVKDLTEAMRNLGLELTYSPTSKHKFAVRPGIGKLGKQIELIANYFPIDIPHGNIYHYDINVDKIWVEETENKAEEITDNHKRYKCQNTKMKRNVVETMIKVIDMFSNIRPAFDGMDNLYTRTPLPIEIEKTFRVTVTDEFDRSNIYEIKIKPVNKMDNGRSIGNSISLEPLHQLFNGRSHDVTDEIVNGVMAIEAILRHTPALRLVPVGRSFFHKLQTRETPVLNGGREIWFGHHQSIKLTTSTAMLNLDRTATTFYKPGPVLNFVIEKLNENDSNLNINVALKKFKSLSDADRKNLKKYLKNIKVQVTHLSYPRKYRIFDITKDDAKNTFFEREVNGRKIRSSVSEYFRSQYKQLQYPNLPCLDVGSDKRHVYLPMEVCEIIEGQHCNKKLSKTQTSDMITHTARPPAERFQEIQNSLATVVQDFRPFSQEFGIRINTNPLRFTGRVLNPPQLQYQNQNIKPFKGSWNMRNMKFHEPVNVKRWILLNFSRFRNQYALEKFVTSLQNGGREKGIDFSRPLLIKSFTYRDGTPGNFIKKSLPLNIELIIVVLPSDNSESTPIYLEIKAIGETELGIMTQCIKDDNISGRNCNPPLISNLCQKINAKLGGINNSLLPAEKPQILKKCVIIIGADCCHPSPGDDVEFSIAAAVGSVDDSYGKYKASIRAQEPKVRKGTKSGQEIIIDIKNMVKDLLQAYIKNNNGRKPEKVIFYRDGVGEGDYGKVMDYELDEIKKACKEILRNENTPITFITVGKRHHTRFAPAHQRDGVGNHGNVPPGTTVDTTVVHPVFFDFFICSHFGIQGTSRPAHYTVLLDENKLKVDELQAMTYYLCHIYARCTRSVSIPAPVMYADLAAYRAKNYIMAKTKISSSSSETSEEIKRNLNEIIIPAIKVVPNMENTMYFI